ncbi:MAG TPA: hypothetical protein VMV89_12490, partial [Candidatus Paceibacterota bacterium]|nr:hypothetical protein [Candidatus Paceibacterota bacterium]
TNDWQLANAKPDEKLDSTKISSVTSPFSSVSFSDVAPLDAKTANAASNIVLTAETFDGFTYVAKIRPEQDDNYPVSFSISASLPAERTAAKDEKPDEKTKLDQAFKEQHDKLVAKLAKEQKYEKWIYYLPSYSLDELLKTRGQLLVETNSETSSTNSETVSQPAE